MTKSATPGSAMSMGREGGPSFIIVKFGDNHEELFNPVCSTVSLLTCIRRKCGCDEDVTIDLVDLQGNLKNLRTRLKEYACEFITSRETYVLIKIEKQGEKEPNKYVSLLENIDQIYPELFAKLQAMSKPPLKKGLSRWNAMSKKGLMVKNLAGIAGGTLNITKGNRNSGKGKKLLGMTI